MYTRFIFYKPENDNFSFADDLDGDGLADNLTSVSGTHTMTQVGKRFHVQQTTGSFYLEQTIDNATDYRIYFDLKTTNTVNVTIKRYDAGDSLIDTWYNTDFTNTSWSGTTVSYTANATIVKLRIYITASSGTAYVDNLAIVSGSTEFIINPSDFSYNLESQAQEEKSIDGSIQFIEPIYRKYKANLPEYAWTWITSTELDTLETLINEKILIRTHDSKSFSAKLMKMNVDYEVGQESDEQYYHVNLELAYY